jgi:tetratricopeptide (TPR) repeat protein
MTGADLNNFLSRARTLAAEGRPLEAARALADALSLDGNSVDFLRELAQIENKQGDGAHAATHLGDALRLDGSNSAIALELVQTLCKYNRLSEARSTLLALPDNLRRDQSIRTALGGIYRKLGWHAHAVEAYGSRRDQSAQTRFSYESSWVRSGGPFRTWRSRIHSSECEIDDDWSTRSATWHAILSTLNWPNGNDRTRIGAGVDNLFLRILSAQHRLGAYNTGARILKRVGICFGIAWLLAALLLNWAFPTAAQSSDMSRVTFAVIIGLITAEYGVFSSFLLYYAAWRISYSRLRGHENGAVNIWFAAVLIGLVVLIRGNQPSELFYHLTTGRVLAFLIVITGTVSIVCLGPIYNCADAIPTLARERPRAFIIGKLLDVLNEMSDPNKRNDLSARAGWISKLQDAAWAMERYFARDLKILDAAIKGSVADSVSEAAVKIRLIGYCIAIPGEHAWAKLVSDLRHNVSVIANGDFGALRPQAIEFAKPVQVRRRRIAKNVLLLIVLFSSIALLIGVLVFGKHWTRLSDSEATVIAALIPVVVPIILFILGGSGAAKSSLSDK